MEKFFNNILDVKSVIGVFFIPENGLSALSFLRDDRRDGNDSYNFENADWKALAAVLGDGLEAELVFEENRIYLRRNSNGFTVVVMEHGADVDLVRLGCEIAADLIDRMKKPNVFRRFFTKFLP